MTNQTAGLELLELGPDASVQDVRRAYARRLKTIDQAADPDAFQRLRGAYEDALAWCERREPDDASVVAVLAADEMARDAFQSFLAAGLTGTEDMVSRLSGFIDKPELQAIEVRQHFERMLIRQLAAGWRPGHERLFEAAVVALAWDLDPDRLRTYGEPGAVLCGAINDRDQFEAQLTAARPLQIDLMDRIRAGLRPSDTDIVRTFRVLDWLMLNYGRWMTITVGARNVARWDGWHDSLPRDRHSIDAPNPEPTHPPEWLGLPDKPSSPIQSSMMLVARGAMIFTIMLFAAMLLWAWIRSVTEN